MRHILLSIVAIVVAATCQARTITVDDNSPADFINIQSAINDANNGDIVIVRPGHYFGDGNRDIRFLGKAITVQSIDPNDPNIVSATVINCNGSSNQQYRGFTFDNNEGPNSILDGLTITGGYGAYAQLQPRGFPSGGYVGGGIFCKNSSPTITHCCITGNMAEGDNALGGGICYWQGGPTIRQCIISKNTSNGLPLWVYPPFSSIGGGGISGNGEGTIIDCVITDNTSMISGGGISCSQSTVINCTISKNVSGRNGGGIECSNSKLLNCTIKENKAGGGIVTPVINPPKPQPALGGGIDCDANSIIINCTIKNNTATAGGIILQGGNALSALGGGIYAYATSSTSAPIITNCIISENSVEGGKGEGTKGSGVIKIYFGPGGDGLGGGIYCNAPYGTVSIANCLIVANKSKPGKGGFGNYPDGNAFGGGAYCTNGNITGCTFAANEAMDGAGIYGQPDVNSCILWDVIEQNSIPINEVFGGASIQYSNVQGGFAGQGNIDADPCFVKEGYWTEVNIPPLPPLPPPLPPWPTPEPKLVWVDGDYHLLIQSPCIDAGDPNYVPGPNETDLDGNRRVAAGRIDMGAFEFPNALPVADAGPNQVAYAWIDGIAEVTLDGSASYDADGDNLSYLWTSSINGNPWESNSIAPAIDLPVGKYSFELVVNDGSEDSEPNYVDINVVKPVKGLLLISPQVIYRQCQQKRIIAILRLPDGITKDQIDSSQKLSLYPGGIEAVNQCVMPYYANGARRWFVFAFFDRDDVLESIGGTGFVKVYAVGQLKTGQYFYGTSTIIISNHGRRPIWGNMRDWFHNYHRSHPCRPKKK